MNVMVTPWIDNFCHTFKEMSCLCMIMLTTLSTEYRIVAILSSLATSDSLSLSPGIGDSCMLSYLHFASMCSWWLQQSVHSLCTVTCSNTCLPQTHNTYRLYILSTSTHIILYTMFKLGFSCPYSVINTVPGEDGHRAGIGRFETNCFAMEPLDMHSVYKASWCGDQNSWTASWGWK